jgi:sarcosine oxidase subunit gamma
VTADGATARAPLQDRQTDLARVGARELAFLAKVDVRIHERAESDRRGISVPTTPNTWRADGEREWLWLGPDEWLVLGPPGSAPGIAHDLRRVLSDVHHSIVDVSANLAGIELGGDRRLDLLACGGGLDLHPRSWRAGMCAQTLLARVPVLLQEREGSTRLFVRPSFAGYLADWIRAVS